MFRSTTFDDFYTSPFGESWYLDRPVLVALVVSLVLHAIAIALLPGMRVPKPEDKPLTVKATVTVRGSNIATTTRSPKT